MNSRDKIRVRILALSLVLLALLLLPRPAPAATPLKLLRTLTAVAAEASVPSSSSFQSPGSASTLTEISFATGGSVANTPDSVSICVWYLVGSTVKLASKYTILTADIARPSSFLIEANASSFYATACAFSGGSSPTVTLSVYARQVP